MQHGKSGPEKGNLCTFWLEDFLDLYHTSIGKASSLEGMVRLING